MALINCPNCGAEVSDLAGNCLNCGTPLSSSNRKKFCQHCGEQIDIDCIVCPNCGKQVSALSQNTPVAPPPIAINAPSSTNASINTVQQTVNTGKPINKAAYCLLAFFLGWIGIHKFYAGKIAMGIIYILFCWTGIPAIIAFIEFIIGLCKKADNNGNIYL